MKRINSINTVKNLIYAFFDGSRAGANHPQFQREQIPVMRVVSRREQIGINKRKHRHN